MDIKEQVEIDLKMASVRVEAETRELRAEWTRELADVIDMSEGVADRLEMWQKKVNREEKLKDLLDEDR